MSVAASGVALARSPRRAGIPAIRAIEGFGYVLLAAFIFFICFTFLRPSPYDFFAIPAMALWLCLGIRLHRSSVPFVGLLLLYHLGLLIALLPYFDEPRTVEWTYQSVYLMLTAIFFAMLFSDDTAKRIEFVLKAYLASCFFAAAAGIASYYDLFDGIVLATGFVGFRLCLAPSPSRRAAQIVWPALFIFFLQALQIDVDHWRHVFLLFGMVWGLEAARLKWLQGDPHGLRRRRSPR
jgi:hypothetical protein